MNALGITLIWCALQVTAFVTAAAVFYFAVRCWKREAGGLIATASLMMVIAISGLAFCPWPRWEWQANNERRPVDVVKAVATTPSVLQKQDLTVRSADPLSLDESALVSWISKLRSALPQHRRVEPRLEPQTSWNLAEYIALIFVLGCGVSCVRLIVGMWTVRSFCQKGRPINDAVLRQLTEEIAEEINCRKRIELLQVEGLTTAATVGWRRPAILLPANWQTWTRQERRAVLAHEISHIRRNDFMTYLLAQMGLLLHFYHPLVHWLTSRLRLEQELAADADAAALAGGRTAYLQTLAAMALRQADQPLGWPARTFLPTRGHLLRRVEMLKHSKRFTTQLSTAPRAILIAVLIAIGIGIVGLREPGQHSALAEEKQAEKKIDKEPQTVTRQLSDKIELAYVPDDAMFVVAIRPAAILQQPGLEQLANHIKEDPGFKHDYGISMEGIEQITCVILKPTPNPKSDGPPHQRTAFGGTMIRTTYPTDFEQLIAVTVPAAEEVQYLGRTYYKSEKSGFCYFRPDERTIFMEREDMLKRFIASGPRVKATFVQGPNWDEVAANHFVYAVDTAALTQELSGAPQRASAIWRAIAPLWEQSDSLIGGGKIEEGLTLQVITDCTNEADAKRVQETLNAAVALLKNLLSGAPAESPEVKLLVESGTALLDAAEVTRKNTTILLSSKSTETKLIAQTGQIALAALNVLQSARDSARQAQARNSLRQIVVGMHKYYDTHGHFPSATVIGPDGKTPHSWRVEILPFIGQAPLYDQYKLDEPWDSDHNKQLLKKMPVFYRHPAAPAGSTNASFYLLTGPRTLFNDDKKAKFSDVRDGVSQTLLVVEAKREIPWTKPEDIAYDPDGPLPKFGGITPGKLNVGCVDGRVLTIPDRGIDEEFWRAVITPAGDEAGISVKFFEKAKSLLQNR